MFRTCWKTVQGADHPLSKETVKPAEEVLFSADI